MTKPEGARRTRDLPAAVTAREALEDLRQGNGRFVAGAGSRVAGPEPRRRAELARGQRPFAVVIGCADSRVPPELVFDQPPGALFVVRVAGNVVGPLQLGSAELAVRSFGPRLVVVLGHSGCGAVTAALDQLLGEGAPESASLQAVLDSVRPALLPLTARAAGLDRDALLARAVRANTRAAVTALRESADLAAAGGSEVAVVGAEYSLETGVVDFFEEGPIG